MKKLLLVLMWLALLPLVISDYLIRFPDDAGKPGQVLNVDRDGWLHWVDAGSARPVVFGYNATARNTAVVIKQEIVVTPVR